MPRGLQTVLAAAGLALAAACAQPPVPPDRFYRVVVDAPDSPPAARAPLSGNLVVERPAADGLLAGRPIIYAASHRPNELQEYNYDFWAKPPSLMIRDALARCLERAHVAERVVTEETRVDADHALVGRLERLDHIVGASSVSRLELRLGLRDNVTGRLLLWKTYEAEAALADDSIGAAIDGFNAAFAEVCLRLVDDIAGL